MKKKKVILAFSGGLDTSFCVLFLKKRGYAVVAVTVDTGGFSLKEIKKIKQRAKELGVEKHYFIDRKEKLYRQFISYIIKGNILRGGVYPLLVSPERIVQAVEVVKVAQKEKAKAVAHGSTGAGNDQVRFDVAIKTLAPELNIIAPIRDEAVTREEEIKYLKKHRIKVEKISKSYSINKGLMGTTIGGKETTGSWETPPDSVYPSVEPIEKTPEKKKEVVIYFEKGLPQAVRHVGYSRHTRRVHRSGCAGRHIPGVDVMEYLNVLGAKMGVGKDIHLGNTILGIKGRVAFEAPALLILIKAHRELEKLVLTKWQSFWKNRLAEVYGNFLHEALYFEPVMRDIEAMIDSSQKYVCGEVKVKLYKGNIIVKGVKSPYSLLKTKVAVYGEENAFYTGREAASFCKLYGLQSALAVRLQKGKNLWSG